MQKLSSWLKKLYPLVEKELDDANTSKAFDGYRLHEEIEGAACRLSQTINLMERHSNKVMRL